MTSLHGTFKQFYYKITLLEHSLYMYKDAPIFNLNFLYARVCGATPFVCVIHDLCHVAKCTVKDKRHLRLSTKQ